MLNQKQLFNNMTVNHNNLLIEWNKQYPTITKNFKPYHDCQGRCIDITKPHIPCLGMYPQAKGSINPECLTIKNMKSHGLGETPFAIQDIVHASPDDKASDFNQTIFQASIAKDPQNYKELHNNLQNRINFIVEIQHLNYPNIVPCIYVFGDGVFDFYQFDIVNIIIPGLLYVVNINGVSCHLVKGMHPSYVTQNITPEKRSFVRKEMIMTLKLAKELFGTKEIIINPDYVFSKITDEDTNTSYKELCKMIDIKESNTRLPDNMKHLRLLKYIWQTVKEPLEKLKKQIGNEAFISVISKSSFSSLSKLSFYEFTTFLLDKDFKTSDVVTILGGAFGSHAAKQSLNVINLLFEKGFKTSDVVTILGGAFGSHAAKESSNVINLLFEKGFKTSDVVTILGGNFGSHAAKESLNVINLLFEKEFKTSDIVTILGGGFGSHAAKDGSLNVINLLFEKGFKTTDVVTILGGNFGSHAAKEESLNVINLLFEKDFKTTDVVTILGANFGSHAIKHGVKVINMLKEFKLENDQIVKLIGMSSNFGSHISKDWVKPVLADMFKIKCITTEHICSIFAHTYLPMNEKTTKLVLEDLKKCKGKKGVLLVIDKVRQKGAKNVYRK